LNHPQGVIDKSQEVSQLQIELIKAFKVPHPVSNCLELDPKSVFESRRDEEELPSYPAAEPQVTEEQTVTIPGEEDLPIRTPTPELLGNTYSKVNRRELICFKGQMFSLLEICLMLLRYNCIYLSPSKLTFIEKNKQTLLI
jgi:hypothetical protein